MQKLLPAGLWLTAAAVAPSFDPRRAAWRQYRYVAPAGGEDLDAMRKAAQEFVGTHAMHAFARVEAGRNPERTVLECSVAPADRFFAFTVRGESFLWNQVRRMVSAILAVGRAEAKVEDIERAFAAGRPHPRFGVAPAEGLLLERVHYEGLLWDAQAGGIDVRRVMPDFVQATIALAVAQHVAGTSPTG
ncbi:MAG: hypothetical protein LC620_06795 [Halobacteriales archaeon]|nr:hypothetical protein [Halobacteriales archaeon]